MLKFPPDLDPDLQLLASLVYEENVRRGTAEQSAAEIALACADLALEAFGGHRKYWVKGKRMTYKRDMEIFHAHKGTSDSTFRLANQYDLSERMIEMIVKRVGDDLRRERQGLLPGVPEAVR